MVHHRVQFTRQARLFLTVIGLAWFGIACQNPLQSPPTFQDKFNQIRVDSNEPSGMTLTEVRKIIGGQGTEFRISPTDKARLTKINPDIRTDRLSRYQWQESRFAIIVIFYFDTAIAKLFSTPAGSVQLPLTFQDKFNQIRLASNETSGMTLTEVRGIIGGQGTERPYSAAERAALLRINPSIRTDRLSRYEWAERPATITVVFYFGAASIKSFTTS